MTLMPLDPEIPDALSQGVAADALGAHATESSKHAQPAHTHCENCEQELLGPYCHQCGQHDFDINRSFGHTFLEALENFFHFDTKLFRNLITLLFRPGRMTAAFNAGKRVAQVPPFRMYVFVSILFFFLTFLDQDESAPVFNTSTNTGPQAGLTIDGESVSLGEAWEVVREEAKNDPEAKEALDQIKAVAESFGEEITTEIESATEAAEEAAEEEELSDLERSFKDKGKILATPEGQRQMLGSFLGAIPKLVLICLPIFALYTRFLFRKSGMVYLQHLVMALHFHTFIYLWLLASEGWTFLISIPSDTLGGFVSFICSLWLIVYPFIMLKHMFANSWILTITKTLILSFAYMFTLAVVFTVTALLLVLAL